MQKMFHPTAMSFVVICLAALLTSCGGLQPLAKSSPRPTSPFTYAEGFADGWHDGKTLAAGRPAEALPDNERFASDPAYAQGWADGFRQAESGQEAARRPLRIKSEQQKLRAEKKSAVGKKTWLLETVTIKTPPKNKPSKKKKKSNSVLMDTLK